MDRWITMQSLERFMFQMSKNQQLEILAPWIPGAHIAPHEPNRIVHLSQAPQAVAITSDGQLGFVALSRGKVAMLDMP